MTSLLLAFAAILLLAVPLSGLAHRTVLSTAVLFLVAEFLLGEGVTDVIELQPDHEIVDSLAELALFAVLFTRRDARRPAGPALGAVLAPTDPVFAAALVVNEKAPPRLRRLLDVESGVNDGLALPFVIVLASCG